MIESKQQALEILLYIMPGERKSKINSLVSKVEYLDRGKIRKIHPEKFWRELIIGTTIGMRFIQKRKINSLEELILAHYDWKMKYQRDIYKHITSDVDILIDELDSSDYLD